MKTFTIFTFFLLMTTLFLTNEVKSQKRWDFNTDGNFEGWNRITNIGWGRKDSSGCISNVMVSGGALSMNITCGDPYIYGPADINLDAANNFIKLKMMNASSATKCQIYFITTIDTIWDENKHVDYTQLVTNDANETLYVIDMSMNYSWTGTIRQFRVDPTSDNNSGSVKIDYIEVTNTVGIQDFSLNNNFINIYPNPTTDLISIENKGNEKSILSIYNTTGELVLENQLTNEKNIVDVSSLSTGMYIVKIFSVHGTIQKKLLKN